MAPIPLLSDEQWAVIEPLLPPVKGAMGRPMRDHRPVVMGRSIGSRRGSRGYTCRHYHWSADGTWDRVLARLPADADARGELDWRVSVDSTMGPDPDLWTR